MAMIPAYAKPYPDELLYSVICRTAGRCSMRVDEFIHSFLGNRSIQAAYIVSDIRREFPAFARSIPVGVDMAEFYLSTTTFRYEAMAMTRGQQARHINAVFRPIDALNPQSGSLFPRAKICPECVKEDAEKFGEPYLHRSHHLSGVTTCHRHKVPLMVFNGKNTHECDFDLHDYYVPEPEFSPDDATAYTGYAQALFEADIDTDVSIVKDVILSRINGLGYGASDDYRGFIDEFSGWEHEALWRPTDRSKFLKRSLTILANTTLSNLVPLLMYLYPDISELSALLKSEPLLEDRECPGCGCRYCTTPLIEQTGWGCPYCDSMVPTEDRFRHLVKTAGRGKYKALDDFTAMQARIPFYHKTCGRISYLRPVDFLYSGVRCKCENMVTEKQAKKAVEHSGEFKLVRFTPVEKNITVHGVDCGHEFTCSYYKFVKSPFCRTCGKRAH